jgi:hypothetical protein
MVENLRKYFGIVLLSFILLMHGIGMLAGNTFFGIYHGIFFAFIRNTYDHTIGYLPFAFFYLVLIGFVWSILRIWWKFKKEKKTLTSRKAYLNCSLSMMNGVLFLFSLFYILWGFNYYRPDLMTYQGWEEVEIDNNTLSQEFTWVTQMVNQTKSKCEMNNMSDWEAIEDTLRKAQTDLLIQWKYPAHGRVRVRPLYPKGSLLRISTAGFYNPFSFEGHVDPGLHPLSWPFTIAHEMAHGYGFTDEGECNFIGLLTCLNTSKPEINYSGWLSYWKYLYFDLKERNPDLAKIGYNNLTQVVKDDLKAIRSTSDQYPDLFPFIRDVIYEFYLKMHGVEDGLESYSAITNLMLCYKNSSQYSVKYKLENISDQ